MVNILKYLSLDKMGTEKLLTFSQSIPGVVQVIPFCSFVSDFSNIRYK